MVQARSQKAAAQSYQCVTARRDSGRAHLNNEDQADYLNTARSLPALVRKAGLAQALAFIHSRDGDGSAALLGDLAAVLEVANATALLDASRTAPLSHYMHLTRRTLSALDWLKRYAETELNGKPKHSHAAGLSREAEGGAS